MQQELTWASANPDEHIALDWQTQTAAFAGQWKRAQELARRAIDLAADSEAKENAAQYTSEAALRGTVFGHCAQTKAAAEVRTERGSGSAWIHRHRILRWNGESPFENTVDQNHSYTSLPSARQSVDRAQCRFRSISHREA